jgi:hypothetical protein
MKTREQILAKAETLNPMDEFSVEADVASILREIAGEESVLTADEIEDLLYSRDIYHFQSVAVRRVRKFLGE